MSNQDYREGYKTCMKDTETTLNEMVAHYRACRTTNQLMDVFNECIYYMHTQREKMKQMEECT
jgi:hypothetical protein